MHVWRSAVQPRVQCQHLYTTPAAIATRVAVLCIVLHGERLLHMCKQISNILYTYWGGKSLEFAMISCSEQWQNDRPMSVAFRLSNPACTIIIRKHLHRFMHGLRWLLTTATIDSQDVVARQRRYVNVATALSLHIMLCDLECHLLCTESRVRHTPSWKWSMEMLSQKVEGASSKPSRRPLSPFPPFLCSRSLESWKWAHGPALLCYMYNSLYTICTVMAGSIEKIICS